LADVTFLITWLGTAAALWVAVWLIDGFDFTGEWWQFLIAALIVGAANAIVKPILRLLSLPIVMLTFGLFLIVVNALVLQLAVWLSGLMDLGLTSDGFFWDTFLASIVVSIVGWLIGVVLPDDGRMSRTT
jgi:putative membrane protein